MLRSTRGTTSYMLCCGPLLRNLHGIHQSNKFECYKFAKKCSQRIKRNEKNMHRIIKKPEQKMMMQTGDLQCHGETNHLNKPIEDAEQRVGITNSGKLNAKSKRNNEKDNQKHTLKFRVGTCYKNRLIYSHANIKQRIWSTKYTK